MKEWKRKTQILTYLFPAMILFVFVGNSLGGYVKPTFSVEASEGDEEKGLEKEEAIPERKEESSQVKVNKNQTVKLPLVSEQTPDSSATKTLKKTADADAYRNGVYYGTGTGFGGKIKVKVTIKNEKIYKIEVVEAQDGKSYLLKASSLFVQIIKKQSTNVDVVSGATYSSNGLIEAVRDALKKAKKPKEKNNKNKTNKDTSSKDKTEDKTEDKTPSGKFPYTDGVYYGTGEGYRGDITTAVCISDHSIQYIMVTEASDDSAFLTRAKSILTTVVQKQSTDVDVVSGATFSSKGIIEAIKNALVEAERVTYNDANLPAQTAAPTPIPSPTVVPSSGEENSQTLIYTNGEYHAEAICSPDIYADFDAYILSLKITIENDHVTSVTNVKGSGVLYDSGNDWYIKRAVDGTSKYPGVAGQIVSKGTYEGVDVVSGATCSSNAIIEAVKKALENAKK